MIKKLSVSKLPEGDPPAEYFKSNDKEVHIKDFEDVDLNRLPSLKALLKDVHAKELLESLSDSMNHIMQIELVGGNTESMKREIVIYVLEEIEKFVLKPSAGSEKKRLAVEILKKVFHDDEVIAGIAVDELVKSIRQVGRVRRICLKVYRYFKKRLSPKLYNKH
jgi:phosphoglucomutase